MAIRLLGILFLLLVQQVAAQDITHEIVWEGNKAKALRIVFPNDLNIDANQIVVEVDGTDRPIFGHVEVKRDTFILHPMVGFTQGMEYHVFKKKKHLFSFVPKRDIPGPSVLEIFPATNQVPANFLKFSVHFDQSIAEGKAYEHISLWHNGEQVPSAFMEMQTELWNADQTLLTVWFDPGRVKRELERNKQLGPILTAGETYEIRITGIANKTGQTMEEPFIKTLDVQQRDEQKPNINKWRLEVPDSASTEPLIVIFNEPLDRMVAQNMISIGMEGKPVKGTAKMISDTKLTFTPKERWKAGNYQLIAEGELEDLAGNNLSRLFDTDLQKNEIDNEGFTLYTLPFEINK